MGDPAATDELVLDLPDAVPPLVRVRQWVACALADLGDDHVFAVQLVATEVLTNAYDHAGGAHRIRLRRDGPSPEVLIEVDDGSPAPPVLGDGNPKSLRGRGLVLVDRLATGWGYRAAAGGGKTVWAVVDCSVPAWSPRG